MQNKKFPCKIHHADMQKYACLTSQKSLCVVRPSNSGPSINRSATEKVKKID